MPDRLSVVMTAHNEGDEVRKTIDSIRTASSIPCSICVIDDASTDACCDGVASDDIQVIRHDQRSGVARSRREGVEATAGDVIAFFDAHQRVEPGCLDVCTQVALEHNAIVTPDISDFDDDVRMHGAFFTFDHDKSTFSAQWKLRTPREPVVKCSSLNAPLYLIPRSVYPKVAWSPHLRGWGGDRKRQSR